MGLYVGLPSTARHDGAPVLRLMEEYCGLDNRPEGTTVIRRIRYVGNGALILLAVVELSF